MYMVARWRKYLRKGGRFNDVDELASLYGMDRAWMESWEDSLYVEEENSVSSVADTEISLNTITIEGLEALGMYTWQAERLIDYRERLGGFCRVAQIWELEIDSSYWDAYYTRFRIGGQVRPLDFNTASVQELARHPYIGWERAKVVEYYRTRIRPIESANDLLQLEQWEQEDIDRLKEYLK